MALTLSTLSSTHGTRKKKKRVGRGNASGHGTYSTRGLKGQKARSGGRSGLKALGLKMVVRGIPKKRGFTNRRAQAVSISISELARHFGNNAIVSPHTLVQKSIISKREARRVKIVGGGTLNKSFTVRAHAFSEGASQAILKASGQVIILKHKE